MQQQQAAPAQQAEQQEQQVQQQAAPQPAECETDFNATVRIAVDTATGSLDPIRAGGVHTLPHYEALGQFDQFSKEFVQSAATFEWVDNFTAGIVTMKPGMTFHDGAPVTAETPSSRSTAPTASAPTTPTAPPPPSTAGWSARSTMRSPSRATSDAEAHH